jgi:hypothetical protein
MVQFKPYEHFRLGKLLDDCVIKELAQKRC